jgi:hypothetical protein
VLHTRAPVRHVRDTVQPGQLPEHHVVRVAGGVALSAKGTNSDALGHLCHSCDAEQGRVSVREDVEDVSLPCGALLNFLVDMRPLHRMNLQPIHSATMPLQQQQIGALKSSRGMWWLIFADAFHHGHRQGVVEVCQSGEQTRNVKHMIVFAHNNPFWLRSR